ncbi:MAG TPA: DUF4381 domain-containing protein [Gammaproteobacteria bacterium]
MPDYSQLPLRDIHMPDSVSWWPPAPGWWILAGLLLALAALWAVRRYRTRHVRAALAAVRAVVGDLEAGAEPVACLQSLSVTMRRFVITVTDGAAAGLTGGHWLEYLDGRWDRDAFTRGAGRLLTAAPYARPGSVSTEQALELAAVCAAWLRAQGRRRRRRDEGARLAAAPGSAG